MSDDQEILSLRKHVSELVSTVDRLTAERDRLREALIPATKLVETLHAVKTRALEVSMQARDRRVDGRLDTLCDLRAAFENVPIAAMQDYLRVISKLQLPEWAYDLAATTTTAEQPADGGGG